MLDALSPRVVERGRTRTIRLAVALLVLGALAGMVTATAAAVVIDDTQPCPAAYQEGGAESGIVPPFVCPDGVVGNPYSVQLVGHGSCEPFFSFTVVNGLLPPGISLSSGGLLSGAPTRAGAWSVRVRIQDIRADDGGPSWCTSSDQAEGEFSIAVSPGVVVTTASAEPGTIGGPYSLALSAQLMSRVDQLSTPPGCAGGGRDSGTCPLTWSVVQGELPAGLRLNPVTGVIFGTPTAEGSYSFLVRAALDDGRAGTKGLTIDVRRPLVVRASRPFAAPGRPTLWEVGVRFAARLAASGGASTYTWSLAQGALPTGLVLTADGTVAGKPRAAGSFRAVVRLLDDEGRTVDHPISFRVAPRLAIATRALRPVRVGRRYRVKLVTTGGLVPMKWSVESGRLPRGIRFDPTDGVLSGTPTRPGRYRITFEANDRLGVRSTRTLAIHVLA